MIINNKRALAYTSRISEIYPIEGADNIELAQVLGWKVIVKKSEFKIGDLCVFFEIDSKLPEADWSEFMRAKDFRVKTMKLNKFNVISQGLALPIKNFLTLPIPEKELIDLTDELGVTYYEVEDNIRKADVLLDNIKFKKKRIWKFLMKYNWFRKILFYFLSRKDKQEMFPAFISKTDEERIENQPFRLKDNITQYVMTEKLDGTSCTYGMKRIKKNKFKFFVCSRNKNIQKDETSIYWQLNEKYKIENVLRTYLEESPNENWVYIQGEGLSPKVQGNRYKLQEPDLYLFNLVTSSNGRYSSYDGKSFAEKNKMKWVPILGVSVLSSDMEDVKQQAVGKSVLNENTIREGIVYRTLDGKDSFKNVSRDYLLKRYKN